MPVLFSNYASAPLAASISSSATTITVTSGQGALFPAVPAGSYFYATLTDSSNNLEIVKVTARSTDALTVTRAQEGTTALAYAAADKLELRVTAAGLTNMVQLDGAQTITGVKTFANGIISTITGNVTGNLTGNVTGNLTGNVTGNLTGNVTGNADTATVAAKLATPNFTIVESGGVLQLKYGTTVIAKIDSSGNITSIADITAFGTM
jgi:hypothetical protein